MQTLPMLLVCLLAASAGDHVLTDEDLLEINEKFVAVFDYSDNEYIYEEKLKELVEKAAQMDEQPVKLVVEVTQVRKENVWVKLFPEVGSRRYPQVRFAEDSDTEVTFFTARNPAPNLGGTLVGGQDSGQLRIGELVSLALARSLRRGDRLQISGTLVEVQVANVPGNNDFQKVAGLVIVASDVQRIAGEDAEDAVGASPEGNSIQSARSFRFGE